MRRALILAVLFGFLYPNTAPAQLVISEFLADNHLGRKDSDGDTEDWIELWNRSAAPVSLKGWSLTDSPGNPRKWPFPDVSIAPGEFLLVFASAKDRRVPGQPLHTNFRLESNGEYLGLIRPDLVPASEFRPAYPPQVSDVSFGIPTESVSVPLLPLGARGTFLVPTNDNLGDLWTRPEFDDAQWTDTVSGTGFDASGTLNPFVLSPLKVGGSLNPSVYLRFPFVVTNVASLDDLHLSIRFNDGFVAYLNGYPIAERNAPVESPGGVVADQLADWDRAGGQGLNGWYYGFYDASADADGTYDADSDFTNTAAGWIGSGTAWDLGPGNPPWTRIGPDTWHPNGQTGHANVHWAIRRWVSQTAGTIKILLSGAKQNTACGNGVTFRVFLNGQSRFARSVSANDATGFTTTLVLDDIRFNDVIDFALDPAGPDGDTDDTCDSSTFVAQILQDANSGLRWNAAAARPRPPAESLALETIPLAASRDRLALGTNVLAFHLLNNAPGDASLLLAPELVGFASAVGSSSGLYFPSPSPGQWNIGGVTNLGPMIDATSHSPAVPGDADAILVSARIRATHHPVVSARLVYRGMYTAEVSLPMFDDGRHDDGAAGDGLWTARIPASAAGPGQMIRWAIIATDTREVSMRFPRYPDARRSPQYLGTVVADPALATSSLPVLHWFIQSPAVADGETGSRGSLFFDGEFYDNIGANVHGQSTRGFPKHSYDFDFNPGYKFRWRDGEPRVDDFNLLSTWADKSHLRNILAYETYAQAGAPAHFALPVRVQQNGRFFSVANLVENGDDNFLQRIGYDPRGALYKMYNSAESTAGAEKKTRKTEGTQDLSALLRGLTSGTTLARQAYLFDNLDLPVVVNYLATRALTGDTDCCHKNYYLYRDSDASGEWSAFPWDVDLSFGRVWTCGSPCLSYYDETIYTNTAIFVGDGNSVFAPVLNTPATRQMYLRRLRSLADAITQPPATSPESDRWRIRTSQLRDQIAPDAVLDLAKWGSWGRRESITQAVDRIHREFLPGRRQYLFSSLVRSGTLPATQPASAVVRFARMEPRTTSGNRLHEFLELTNANAFAVDVSDWRIDGPVRFRFKPGTVIPARSNAVVSPDRRQFRTRTTSPKGGERLLVLGNYDGELDARGGKLSLIDGQGRVVHSAPIPPSPSPTQSSLHISELMVNPLRPATGPASEAEFIEIQNVGNTPLDLSGVRFTQGVRFDFSTGAVRTLDPGHFLLVVANLNAFQARYGFGLPIAGVFTGSLDNSGENLRLEDPDGEPILDFHLDTTAVPLAAGLGHSLVHSNPLGEPSSWSDPTAWRASSLPGGSPGTAEPVPQTNPPVPVVINEVLSHTDPPLSDAVELHNPTTTPADVSGWWLTDSPSQAKKFRLPPGSIIPPHGFLVLDESQFNAPADRPGVFSFSSHGDEAWIFAARPDGSLDGYASGIAFPAAANGVSFGRHTNSLGEIEFPPQKSRTLGGPNSGPASGPVAFTEILASPQRGDAPFIELRNLTVTNVALFDPQHPTNTWRIHGVDFAFPTGFVLPAGGYVLIVGGDPTTFRIRNQIPPGMAVFGPWKANLQANGERLRLERPDSPDILPDGSERVPYVLVDSARYGSAQAGLSTLPDGRSWERLRASEHGDDPANWRPGANGPTPGFGSDLNRPPQVQAGPGQILSSSRFPLPVALAGTADDDGHPDDPGRVSVIWSRVDGPSSFQFVDPTRTNSTALFFEPGRYTLRLTASDGAASQSAEVVFEIRRAESLQTPIALGGLWRYFASDRAPAGNWTDPAFDHSKWSVGNGQLGYGDGDERTAFPDSVNGSKVLTAYFRTTFTVDDPAKVRSLAARLVRDDGAALWINGSNVFRSNLPEGPLVYETPATASVTGTDESTVNDIPLDPSVLRSGLNLIAAEVHQQNPASSDLSFDLALDLVADAFDPAYTEWLRFHFTTAELADLGISGDFADPDGDGRTNEAEYRGGTDPRMAQNGFRLVAERVGDGNLRLQFPAEAGRTYAVEWRSSLETGTWQLLERLDARSTSGTVTVTVPGAAANNSHRFYRITSP